MKTYDESKTVNFYNVFYGHEHLSVKRVVKTAVIKI
jgi:hypothetical protein